MVYQFAVDPCFWKKEVVGGCYCIIAIIGFLIFAIITAIPIIQKDYLITVCKLKDKMSMSK